MSRLHPIAAALAAFARTPDTTAPPAGPHLRDVVDLKRVMSIVLIALAPCAAYAFYVHGLRLVPIFVVSYGVGLSIEATFAIVRRKPINEGYFVTGALIALIVPVTIPLWQLAAGVAFAVVFGKEAFGGTGGNIFNPALLCRAFLFFAYPAQMTGDVWAAEPAAAQVVAAAPADEVSEASAAVDAVTGATPLDLAANARPGTARDALASGGFTLGGLFLGDVGGTPGEGSKLAVLLGALVLVVTGVGSLRVMVAGVAGLVATSGLVLWVAPATGGLGELMPWEHLLLGGFLFGIVFMATDPVTSPETGAGQWVFGLGCGAVTVLVRVFNPAYPEGTMLAILLMNAFAPAIDRAVLAVHVRARRARRA